MNQKNTHLMRPSVFNLDAFESQKIKIVHLDPDQNLLSLFYFLSVFPNNLKASAILKRPPQ